MLSAASHAVVPDAAFKGVSRPFKKKYFSPTVGRVALDHLIPNIRFHWGVKATFDEKNNRIYTSDTSQDPLWRVTRVLFPSVDGNLGDRVNNDDNHQHFSNYVTSPKTIALLMCYAEEVRSLTFNYLNQVKDIREGQQYNAIEEGRLTKVHGNGLEKLKRTYAQRIKETLSYPNFSNALLNPFLNDITLAVYHEEVSALSLPPKPERTQKRKGTRSPSPDGSTAASGSTAQPSSSSSQGSSSSSSPLSQAASSSGPRSELLTLAPQHTLEQVILGFLCFHFDKQEDLWDYMEEVQKLQAPENEVIDAEFVNPHEQDLFDEERDPDVIVGKENGACDLDDIYNLKIVESLRASVPYRQVLSNGSAWVYDRAQDAFYVPNGKEKEMEGLRNRLSHMRDRTDAFIEIPTGADGRMERAHKPFADCGEMTIRHILNLILYNKQTHHFDLDRLRGIQTPYIQHLFDFFNIQSNIHTAKDGSEVMRSLWNRVVGDLNGLHGSQEEASDALRPDLWIRYLNKRQGQDAATYDLCTDFENILSVFEKILAFGLTPFSPPSQPQENDDSRGVWLADQYLKLLTFLNPHHIYNVVYKEDERFKEGEHEPFKDYLYGDLTIQVNNDFKFRINMQPGHGEIEELKLLKVSPTDQQYTQKLTALLADPALIPADSVETSLITFAQSKHYLATQKLNDFFKLMCEPMDGNQDIFSFVVNLSFTDMSQWSDDVMSSLDLTLRNILEEYTWDDRASVERLTPQLMQLSTKTKRLPLAFASVPHLMGKLSLSTKEWQAFDVNVFKNIDELDLRDSSIDELVFKEDFPNLKKLILSNITQRIEGFEHLRALEAFSFGEGRGESRVKSLAFPLEMPYLKKLAVPSGATVTGLENLTAIQELNFLGVAPFFGDLSAPLLTVERLQTPRDLETMIDLDFFPNLSFLNMESSQVRSLNFTNRHEKITEFYPPRAAESITGLENLPHLNGLNLQGTNVKTISIGAEMPNLKMLLLSGRSEEIEGFSFLTGMRFFEVGNTLKGLRITRDMPNLVELTGIGPYSDFTFLEGIEHLVSVHTFSLQNAKIKTLRVGAPMHHVQEISLPKTLETLEGAHHLGVKTLDLTRTKVAGFYVEEDNDAIQSLIFDPYKTTVSRLDRLRSLQEIKFYQDDTEGIRDGREVRFNDVLPMVTRLELCDGYLNDTPHKVVGLENLPLLCDVAMKASCLGQKGATDLLNLPSISTVRLAGGFYDMSQVPDHISNVLISGFRPTIKGKKSEWTIAEYPRDGVLTPEMRAQPGRRIYVNRIGSWEEIE
ncbi:MAG: hypothetical protein C0514_04260 [Candidatus Puniceispirillum sp.]|nr:hypothetical protein [Candidatus Puniceispirillum sp.]